MPKKIHKCAMKLQKQGKSEQASWAICTDAIKNKKSSKPNKPKGKNK